MVKSKLLLFDIDGTLLITGGAGRIALEKAFYNFFGIANAWGDLIPDGKTDPLILDEIGARTLNRKLTQEEHSKMHDLYHHYFRDEFEKVTRFEIMPAILELIPKLHKSDKFVLGVATGNYEEAAWLKLKRANLHNFFSFGGFGSDAHCRTEVTAKAIERAKQKSGIHFEKENIFVIGDTIFDIRAAKNLKVNSVAVATGHTKKETLLNENPDCLINNFLETEKFLNYIEFHE